MAAKHPSTANIRTIILNPVTSIHPNTCRPVTGITLRPQRGTVIVRDVKSRSMGEYGHIHANDCIDHITYKGHECITYAEMVHALNDADETQTAITVHVAVNQHSQNAPGLNVSNVLKKQKIANISIH